MIDVLTNHGVPQGELVESITVVLQPTTPDSLAEPQRPPRLLSSDIARGFTTVVPAPFSAPR